MWIQNLRRPTPIEKRNKRCSENGKVWLEYVSKIISAITLHNNSTVQVPILEGMLLMFWRNSYLHDHMIKVKLTHALVTRTDPGWGQKPDKWTCLTVKHWAQDSRDTGTVAGKVSRSSLFLIHLHKWIFFVRSYLSCCIYIIWKLKYNYYRLYK